MPQTRTFLAIVSVLFLGCRNSSEVKLHENKYSSTWKYLNIRTNEREFSVLENDTFFQIHLLGNAKDSISAFKITNAEKDSLFTWSEKLLDKKESPTQFCTDYFGNLDIKIVYDDQMTKKIEYNSICEWQNLDSNTFKIYKLITAKSDK